MAKFIQEHEISFTVIGDGTWDINMRGKKLVNCPAVAVAAELSNIMDNFNLYCG